VEKSIFPYSRSLYKSTGHCAEKSGYAQPKEFGSPNFRFARLSTTCVCRINKAAVDKFSRKKIYSLSLMLA
jgi:hypothetical protein